jgi:hypothetical protein
MPKWEKRAVAKSQHKRFIDATREHDVSGDEAVFYKDLKQIAKTKSQKERPHER